VLDALVWMRDVHRKLDVEDIGKVQLKLASSKLEVETLLELETSRPISIVNWPEFSARVSSRWKLVYGEDAFFLHFKTEESHVRALHIGEERPVCEDSCVEFFVAWSEAQYFNFEINPVATVLVQKGSARENRKNLDAVERRGLRVWGNSGVAPFERHELTQWEIYLVIPFSIFDLTYAEIKQAPLKANFYKCGDLLLKPHYLSWAPVATQNPDFHRPEFFRELRLGDQVQT